MTPRYLFLATEGFPSTVYASQVGDLLRVLDRAGLRFDVLNFDPLYPRTLLLAGERDKVSELRAALPGQLWVRPTLPYEDRVGQPLARRLLGRFLRGRRPTVIHARGVWAARLAAQFARRRPWVRFVYDVRGDYLAEHALHHRGRSAWRNRLGAWRIRRSEEQAVRAAGRLLCVSRNLAEVLEQRYPGAGARCAVVPSGYDPIKFRRDDALRAAWRARLGLEERFVLVYTGSMIHYQCPETLARAGVIARRLRPDAHLLLLTPEVPKAHGILRAAGLGPQDATCLRAAHHEMAGYLNAADLGLLFRRADPVNRAASPTKVAEYLACGLPLLIGEGVGDYSALVREERLGRVLADPDDPTELEAALRGLLTEEAPRERIATLARERLARDRFLPVYQELYRGLADAVSSPGERPRTSW